MVVIVSCIFSVMIGVSGRVDRGFGPGSMIFRDVSPPEPDGGLVGAGSGQFLWRQSEGSGSAM